MRAQAYQKIGQDKLEPVDLPVPEPGLGEVRVRLRCAGVNPVDWKAMNGLFEGVCPYQFPAVPGWDGSGVVDAVGADVNAWQPDDEVIVYGRGATIGLNGTYAEYACFPEDVLATRPANLTWVEAAAVPLASLTAWQALVDQAGLQAGQVVIIPAAAGGVGSLAVQLAKSLGAEVIASCSLGNRDYVASLGADRILDYGNLAAELPHDVAHCLLGLVPASILHNYMPGLHSGGIVVPLSGHAGLDCPGVVIRPMLTEANGAQLQRLAGMFTDHILKPPPIITEPLSDANTVLEDSRKGHVRGKRVLIISDDQ
jgi:NADPH2:quinone reductase